MATRDSETRITTRIASVASRRQPQPHDHRPGRPPKATSSHNPEPKSSRRPPPKPPYRLWLLPFLVAFNPLALGGAVRGAACTDCRAGSCRGSRRREPVGVRRKLLQSRGNGSAVRSYAGVQFGPRGFLVTANTIHCTPFFSGARRTTLARTPLWFVSWSYSSTTLQSCPRLRLRPTPTPLRPFPAKRRDTDGDSGVTGMINLQLRKLLARHLESYCASSDPHAMAKPLLMGAVCCRTSARCLRVAYSQPDRTTALLLWACPSLYPSMFEEICHRCIEYAETLILGIHFRPVTPPRPPRSGWRVALDLSAYL